MSQLPLVNANPITKAVSGFLAVFDPHLAVFVLSDLATLFHIVTKCLHWTVFNFNLNYM